VKLNLIIFIVHPWVARSHLKLYFFSNEFIYLSKCFTRPGPIEVKGEEV
jgi:hypothetical protein